MNIGLTGGIGCGKSTALRFFADAGARVVEADAVVRQLLEADAGVAAAIRDGFGNKVFTDAGKIDRAALGRSVFHDSDALAKLESILHPRVREVWMRELHLKYPLLVVEIPLLFEKGLQVHFDKTVCLACNPATQRERLLGRGMSESQFQLRKQRQLSMDEKMRLADTVLINEGSLDHLRAQVLHLVQRWRSAAPELR